MEVKESFKKHYKELTDYDTFIRYCFTPLRRAIRVNTLKISVDKLKERLPSWNLEQVPWCREGFWVKNEERKDVGNLIEHTLGYFYVQEPASMIPPVILKPQPGERILDMCASPGSKSTQIAQYMDNKGILVANDYKGIRLKPLALNIQRMGIRNAVTSISFGQNMKEPQFDKILLDAPCSGTGTIRKSLKTIDIWNINMIHKLADTQKKLASNAINLLKPGGILVYSTCSVEPEEDEGVISYLLDNHDVELEDIELDLNRSEPVTVYQGKKYNEEVKRCLRMWPQDNDTEGFFVARLRKCG